MLVMKSKILENNEDQALALKNQIVNLEKQKNDIDGKINNLKEQISKLEGGNQ